MMVLRDLRMWFQFQLCVCVCIEEKYMNCDILWTLKAQHRVTLSCVRSRQKTRIPLFPLKIFSLSGKKDWVLLSCTLSINYSKVSYLLYVKLYPISRIYRLFTKHIRVGLEISVHKSLKPNIRRRVLRLNYL